MQAETTTNTTNALKNKDLVTWRVMGAQRKYQNTRINTILRARPRQRSHMHNNL